MQNIKEHKRSNYQPKKPKKYWNKLGRREVRKELKDIVRFNIIPATQT